MTVRPTTVGLVSVPVALAALALLAGCEAGDQRVAAGHARRGSIAVSVGDVSLEPGASVAGTVAVKAGRVEIGRAARVASRIQVGNGSVALLDSARAGSVVLGNGQVTLGRGAAVDGPVTVANGLLEVAGARVDGLVELVRGRLEVGAGGHLAAGLRVDNPAGLLPDSTFVVIRAGARVEGPVDVTGLARLIVEAGADTAGARFSGVPAEPRE